MIPEQKHIVVAKTIDELLENCEILSIHVPFNESNNQLLNKSQISKLPKNSIIINTSRGEIINEIDLLESLNSSRILGAALDVLTDEHINSVEEKVSSKEKEIMTI